MSNTEHLGIYLLHTGINLIFVGIWFTLKREKNMQTTQIEREEEETPK